MLTTITYSRDCGWAFTCTGKCLVWTCQQGEVGWNRLNSGGFLTQAIGTAALGVSDVSAGLTGWQNALHTRVGHTTYTMTATPWAWGQEAQLGPKMLQGTH